MEQKECDKVPIAENSYLMHGVLKCSRISYLCQVVQVPSKPAEKITLLATLHFKMWNHFQYLDIFFSYLNSSHVSCVAGGL